MIHQADKDSEFGGHRIQSGIWLRDWMSLRTLGLCCHVSADGVAGLREFEVLCLAQYLTSIRGLNSVSIKELYELHCCFKLRFGECNYVCLGKLYECLYGGLI